MFIAYEVGKTFPQPNFKATIMGGDGMIISPIGTFIDLIVFLNKPSTKEVKAFKKGGYEYGLFVSKFVPVITLKIPSINTALEGTFNVFKILDEKPLEDFITDRRANLMNVYLVDSSNYILKSQRIVGTNLDFVANFKQACFMQYKTYPNAAQVSNVERAGKRVFTMQYLLKHGTNYKVPPIKSRR